MNPNDALFAVGASGVAGAGLGGAVLLAKLGVPRTYVRDLVHVGTGIWVISWPFWSAPVLPIAITAAALVLVLAGPRALRSALTGGDERWSGIVIYVLSYCVLTILGFTDALFPAAAGLLALSLGDGIGGLVGRRFGRLAYRAPGAKKKTLEGSLTVAVMSSLGGAFASAIFGAHASLLLVVQAGIVAALVEAFAPRGTDNALLPLSVWLFVRTASLT